MLQRLTIQNYALIDTLDVQLDAHLNIITGETGAGKSILLGAMGLILGNRVESRYFFDTSKKCVIEGHFQIKAYKLQGFFAENDLDYEEHTIIRREIIPEGRSRAFVNDTPVTLNVLKYLGSRLIDIHSQHATLQLKQESFQRQVLDSVSDNASLRDEYAEAFRIRNKLIQEIKEVEERIATAKAERDYHQFIFDELESAQLVEEEEKELEEEQKILENAELILQSIQGALQPLEEEDANILQSLRQVGSSLYTLSNYIPSSQELLSRLKSVEIELQDISFELSKIQQNTELDEGRLDFVNERISTLYGLFQKHQVETSQELLVLQEKVGGKLVESDELELALDDLTKALKQSEEHCKELAEKITSSRLEVVERIKKYTEDNLDNLGMKGVRFDVEISELEELTLYGKDKIVFLFAANRGQSLLPIADVASGGELSRVMLVIKSLVAQSSSLPTIVFDEIDTGISGEVALNVGHQLERLAQNMQVITITHLPQIASRGRSHFKVFKNGSAEKTVTSIIHLTEKERVQEVAEMLSGTQPGEAAIQNAMELLQT